MRRRRAHLEAELAKHSELCYEHVVERDLVSSKMRDHLPQRDLHLNGRASFQSQANRRQQFTLGPTTLVLARYRGRGIVAVKEERGIEEQAIAEVHDVESLHQPHERLIAVCR
jgi:hypothetical protein